MLYFFLSFAAGVILGVIRVLLLVPTLGTRTAELIEAPIMLVVIVFTANWVIRRCDIPPAPYKRLAVGVIALGILLLAEFTVVLGLQRLTVDDYLASRDPVAGTVYVLMLVVFTSLPVFVARKNMS
jgi:hypothetical protein